MLDLEQVIQSSEHLTPLPESAARLAALLGDDGWTLEDVADVVKLDGPLVAQVLRRANSAANAGLARSISIDSALMRLGPGAILSLAVGSATKKDLDCPLPVYHLNEGELWRHSATAALAIEVAARRLRIKTSPEAYAAALLHDIGKLILGRFLDGSDQGFVERARSEGGLELANAEMEILDVHHGEVGALMARHWGLPEGIVAGIEFHHEPDQAPVEFGMLCTEVALADQIASHIGAKDGDEKGDVDFEPQVLERLSIDRSQLDSVCEEVLEKLEEVMERYE